MARLDPSGWDFCHVPIAHPLITRGGPGEWDECLIEACDLLEDHGTYYLYYHGTPLDAARWPRRGYRLGVATAKHPLGPFVKHPGNPILDLGDADGWEGTHVACATLLKEGCDRYLMWYSGLGREWSIGLATAPSPLGPWTRHPRNPVLPGLGYAGGVVKVGREYWLYTEHPIGASGPDYGPLALARAEAPDGPWSLDYTVLPTTEWGAWDDGGYSEAKVVRHEGRFHVFYGGAKLHPTRILSRESIGYAWSDDGIEFHRHPLNPVAGRQAVPNAAAFAEVHARFEPPLVYCYHTLRYVDAERDNVEDVGAQVLALSRPYQVTVPVVHRAQLEPGETAAPAMGAPLCFGGAQRAALTVTATFAAAADRLEVTVAPSPDGRLASQPGEQWSRGPGPAAVTRALPLITPFARLEVRHAGSGAPVRDVQATLSLQG